MLGRRKFLGTVGVTAVAVAAARTLGGSGGRGTGGKAARGQRKGRAPQARLVDVQLENAGVRAKARFGTCEVLGVESTPDRGVGVRLADSAGQPFEVLLLGHDRRTPGVARAGSLSVYMKNKGDGATATVEEHGLAAMALARHLARREAAGTKLPALPTLTQRLAREARA